jgi:hypothetical protein
MRNAAVITEKTFVPLKKSEKEEEKEDVPSQELTVAENKTRVSNWMIAIGVGAVVAVGTAVVVYHVRRNRQIEKDGNEMYSPYANSTVKDYENVFSRYWGLTKTTFASVRSSITGFFKSEEYEPFHSSTSVSPFGLDQSTDQEEDAIIL